MECRCDYLCATAAVNCVGPIRIERMSSLVSYRAHRPLCYGPRTWWGPTRFERVSSSLQGWRDDHCATTPRIVCLDQREDLARTRTDDRDQLVERRRRDSTGPERGHLLDDSLGSQPRTLEDITCARTDDRCERV
jgi:hypothetical protein